MNLKEIYDISKNYGVEIHSCNLYICNKHIGYIMNIGNNYVVQFLSYVEACITVEDLQKRLTDYSLMRKQALMVKKLRRIKRDFV